MAANNEKKKYSSVEDILILCKTCHWCVTYFDKSRLPTEKCLVFLFYPTKHLPLIITIYME